MSDFKTKWKVFRRIVGECALRALTPAAMYFVASILLMLIGTKVKTPSATITWAVVCAIGALAYNGFLMWVCGGSHYEMLVSGNLKRRSAMQLGSELKITSYKFQKEYRPWKGFIIGAFAGIFVLIGSIIFGCNQTEMMRAAASEDVSLSGGLTAVVLIFNCLAGWALFPFVTLNNAGTYVSYFLASLLILLPIAVSGGLYIAGAYGRRNKTLRQQEIAARAAEAEQSKPKKINYGGLPGTKPKKRK